MDITSYKIPVLANVKMKNKKQSMYFVLVTRSRTLCLLDWRSGLIKCEVRVDCGVVSESYKVQGEEWKACGMSSLQNSDDTV